MFPVILYIHAKQVCVEFGLRRLVFDTTGPDDPRIDQAVSRCMAEGYSVQTINLL